MGIFNFLKRKEPKLTENQLKWNKMWELWEDRKTESPYTELMTYQSEINNVGHDQYFTNVENTADFKKELFALESILSPKLINNLQKAYTAYLVLSQNDNDENAEKIIEQCDDIFYENEEEINKILEEYATKIKL